MPDTTHEHVRRQHQWFGLTLAFLRLGALVAFGWGIWQFHYTAARILTTLSRPSSASPTPNAAASSRSSWDWMDAGTYVTVLQVVFALLIGALLLSKARPIAMWVTTWRQSNQQVRTSLLIGLILFRLALIVCAFVFIRLLLFNLVLLVTVTPSPGGRGPIASVDFMTTLILRAIGSVASVAALFFSGRLWSWLFAGFDSVCPRCTHELTAGSPRCLECGLEFLRTDGKPAA